MDEVQLRGATRLHAATWFLSTAAELGLHTVLHGGFAAVQDDIETKRHLDEEMLTWEV